MTISEIMTPEVLVIREGVSLKRMLELFAKHEITGAPVIDHQGELVGVVSLTDLSLHNKREKSEFYLNPSWGSIPTDGHELEDRFVSDIMTHLVICAEEEDDIAVAADLMTCHGIHRVVVTKEGKVTGVITSGDLVREFRDRLMASTV